MRRMDGSEQAGSRRRAAQCVARALAAVLLLPGPAATVHAQQSASASRHDQQTEPATLSLWNRHIVTFRAVVAGVPPAGRVRNAHARIAAHTEDGRTLPVATRAVRIGDAAGVVITLGGHVAFGIVEGDLDVESAETAEQAAARAAGQLRQVLNAQAQQRRWPLLARSVALALLTVVMLLTVLRLIFVGREWAVRRLDGLLHGRELAIAGIDIRPTLSMVERATFRVLSWALIGAATYLATTVVLHLFPYTEPLGQRIGAYTMDALLDAALTLFEWTPNVIAIVAVLMITRAASLWMSRLLAEVEHGARVVSWLEQEQARATRRIASGAVWALGVAIAYPLLPWSNNLVFQGMSVVLGLAVSLASTGLINQWISGLVLLYSRSFRIGDYILVGDAEGVVTEMGALATKLRTMRREEVTVPNAVVTTAKLTNFTRLASEQGALLSVSLSVGYAVPWEQVRALLMRAAARTHGVRTAPAPRVLQWELSDFYVEYRLHVFIDPTADRIAIRSDLNAAILSTFAAAGVQIMTPHFESQPDALVLPAASSHG